MVFWVGAGVDILRGKEIECGEETEKNGSRRVQCCMSYARRIPNCRGKSVEEAKVDLENSDHGTRADEVIQSWSPGVQRLEAYIS